MSFPISPAPNDEYTFGGRVWVWDGRAWRAQQDPGSSIGVTIDASQIVSGIIPVVRGGTGIGAYTTGSFLVATGPSTLGQRSPSEVLSDIGAAPTTHNHTLISLTDVSISGTAVNDILKWNGSAWANSPITDLGFAPLVHTHTISDVTDLQDTLDDKSDVGHSHVIADVTDLQAALDDRAISVVSKLNSSGTITLTRGTAVSTDPVTGHLVKANCTNVSALHFLGFVYDEIIQPNTWGRVAMEGAINSTVAEWQDSTTEVSQLAIGRKYYLSDQDGKISFTPPSSGYVKQVGFAATNLLLDIRIGPSIKIN